MHITDSDWEIKLPRLSVKQELFDYALAAGVPIDTPASESGKSYRDDEELYVGSTSAGLLSYGNPEKGAQQLNLPQVKKLIDNFQKHS